RSSCVFFRASAFMYPIINTRSVRSSCTMQGTSPPFFSKSTLSSMIQNFFLQAYRDISVRQILFEFSDSYFTVVKDACSECGVSLSDDECFQEVLHVARPA